MKERENKIDLFLDSGAFSAKTQGVSIDIYEYIKFIKEHEDVINIYANLDVIGDAKATWQNQKIMEEAGLNPIPCFHFGEDFRWLEKYARNYEYIAIGGMVNTPGLVEFLDTCWNKYLTDEKGMPVCKVHGFGLTSLPLMMRYPWYSVDSTSWVVTGRLGGIYMPRKEGEKWIYDDRSWKISVSNQSPDRKEAGQHIDTLSPIQRKIVMSYIEEKGYKLGKSEFKIENQTYELKENERWSQKKPTDKKEKRRVEILVEEGISNKYQLRDELNIIYFLDLEKQFPKYPWAIKKQEINKSLF